MTVGHAPQADFWKVREISTSPVSVNRAVGEATPLDDVRASGLSPLDRAVT